MSVLAEMSPRRLRVLQILPSLDGGGVERGTLEIAQALVARGHESVVLSAGGRLVAELESQGSRHIAMDLGRKSPLTFLQYRQLRELFAREKFDIVHARSRLPAWVTWLAWRGMNPATRPHFVTTVHGLYSVNAYSGIMCKGERVIAVSNTVRDYIHKNYADRQVASRDGTPTRWPRVDMNNVVTIPRGVDPLEFPWQFQPSTEWLKAFRAQYPMLEGKFVLTLPGRMTRLKGHLDFIKVIDILRRQGIDAVGLIVGGDDPKRPRYAAEIRTVVADSGLADRILFLGHRTDIREIYAVSDVVLTLSTKPEAFGRTVLEALSLGRPVIGYSHGGVAEILSGLYPFGAVHFGNTLSGDPHKIATKVIQLCLALSEGRAFAVARNDRFLLADMQAATLAVYEELAS